MRAVHRDPGIRQVDVKDRIFAEPNTVTAMVTLLESRGILRRKPSPSDARAKLLYLTAHGQAVMKKLSEDWEPMRALLRKCFSGKAGEEALEILDTVYVEMERERENLIQRAYMDHPLGPDYGKADAAASDSGAHPPRYPLTAPAQPTRITGPGPGQRRNSGAPERIFLNEECRARNLTNSQLIRFPSSADGLYLSDHYPVIATFLRA